MLQRKAPVKRKAPVNGSTQVLIDVRNDINARKAQLIRDVIALLDSLTSNQHSEAVQILYALERDLIVTIARNLGIQTAERHGYMHNPVDTNLIRKQIINHYTCPAGRV